jgi:ribosome production factor 1
MGKIAGWAAGRGFTNLVVVNENMKKPSAYPHPFTAAAAAPYNRLRQDAITLVHLPDGPTAYLRLTSIELTKKIFVRFLSLSRRPSSL